MARFWDILGCSQIKRKNTTHHGDFLSSAWVIKRRDHRPDARKIWQLILDKMTLSLSQREYGKGFFLFATDIIPKLHFKETMTIHPLPPMNFVYNEVVTLSLNRKNTHKILL